MPEFIPNLRDLGGLPVHGGGRVRKGVLLRSALPLPDDVVPEGTAWPPRVVIDLRSAEELQVEHPLAATGAVVHHVPLLSALRPGVAPPEQLAGLYQLMLDTTADHLVNIVEVVADAPGPTLVHCFAGKDRTGISVALLLSLVGVPREQVVTDYLRTLDNEEQIEARFRRVRGPRRSSLPPSYFTTVQAAIDTVLDVWEADPEGAGGWFLRAGGQQESIDRLRRALIE